MTGLYWVIIIFVLQAVISALAKRAQKNAESQAMGRRTGPTASGATPSGATPSGATPSGTSPGGPNAVGAGAGSAATMRTTTGATAVNPQSSAVLPPRPTVVGRAPGAMGASVSKPTPFKVVRPNAIATGGSPRAGAKPIPQRVPVQPSKQTPPTAQAKTATRFPAAPSAKPPVRAIPVPPGREEADAMASRAKVAQSVAKVRSVESSVSGQHVAGLGGAGRAKLEGGVGKAAGPLASRAGPSGFASLGSGQAFSAARIAEAFRNPHRIREAIILSEVIGPPRGAR